MGKRLYDEIFADEFANNALWMIESPGRLYHGKDAPAVLIPQSAVLRAPEHRDVEDDESRYVRDCFDMLMFYLDRIEHYVAIDLVVFQDVESPADYYVAKMAPHKVVYVQYVRSIPYPRVLHFLQRYPSLVPSRPASILKAFDDAIQVTVAGIKNQSDDDWTTPYHAERADDSTRSAQVLPCAGHAYHHVGRSFICRRSCSGAR